MVGTDVVRELYRPVPLVLGALRSGRDGTEMRNLPLPVGRAENGTVQRPGYGIVGVYRSVLLWRQPSISFWLYGNQSFAFLPSTTRHLNHTRPPRRDTRCKMKHLAARLPGPHDDQLAASRC